MKVQVVITDERGIVHALLHVDWSDQVDRDRYVARITQALVIGHKITATRVDVGGGAQIVPLTAVPQQVKGATG